MVNQEAFETAVQEQPPAATTPTVALAAPGPTEAESEVIESVQTPLPLTLIVTVPDEAWNAALPG
jgi:hypothetical protein